MTCIVGFEQGGQVWIGGDSCAMDCNDGDVISLAQPKVWELPGGILIGHTGGIRGQQALRFGIDWNAVMAWPHWNGLQVPENLVMEFLCRAFVPAAIKAYREFGVAVTRDGQERADPFLLGFQGKLYEIEEEFAVIRSTRPYAAVGSGRKYALGAMAVLDDQIPVEKRIRMALQAAATHNVGVTGPFTVIGGPKAG